MPEEVHHGPPDNPAVRHERRDVSVRGLIIFLGVLTVGAVVAHVVLYWMYEWMLATETAQYPKAPAFVREKRKGFPEQLEVIREKHHSPPLQVADIEDMRRLREAEERALKEYRWLDPEKGVVRIPVDEALRMLDDPRAAKAHGIVARELKDDPKRKKGK